MIMSLAAGHILAEYLCIARVQHSTLAHNHILQGSLVHSYYVLGTDEEQSVCELCLPEVCGLAATYHKLCNLGQVT